MFSKVASSIKLVGTVASIASVVAGSGFAGDTLRTVAAQSQHIAQVAEHVNDLTNQKVGLEDVVSQFASRDDSCREENLELRRELDVRKEQIRRLTSG